MSEETLGALCQEVLPSGKRWGVVVALLLALALGAGGTAWWRDWNGPLRPEERQSLTDLVSARAARDGVTTRAVWEVVKQREGVRRVDDLRRRDWEGIVKRLGEKL